jgi:CO/xanthine dehydrogenase Mo-binding subunit
MFNIQMTNYAIPTAADVPSIRVYFEEIPYAYGPAGAKGIGELPLDGTAPAVVNALVNALGVEIEAIPALPEVLMESLEQQEVVHG